MRGLRAYETRAFLKLFCILGPSRCVQQVSGVYHRCRPTLPTENCKVKSLSPTIHDDVVLFIPSLMN